MQWQSFGLIQKLISILLSTYCVIIQNDGYYNNDVPIYSSGEAKGGGAISRPKGATAKGSMGGIVLTEKIQ